VAGIILAQVRWDDLTDPTADTAITTHHYEVPITPPGPGDVNAFLQPLNTFLVALNNRISTDVSVIEVRFWNVPPGPAGPLGEPFHIEPMSVVGGSGAFRLPPQVACSVTEGTAVRKRWGRFYIPGLTTSSLQQSGRFDNPVVDQIADAAEDFAETMAGNGRPWAVYRRLDGSYQLVRELRVDNVPDIIRRRRFSVTTFRAIRSLI